MRVDLSLPGRVEAVYADLGPAERHIADLLLQDPLGLATTTTTELAAGSGSSKATVSRFFRRLGFDSFAEARASVRDLRTSGVPIGSRSGRDGLWARHRAAEERNLRRTAEAVPEELLAAVGAVVADARDVLVLGFRNSYPVALHLREQLVQARPRVQLAPLPGQSLAEELAALGPGDVALTVGFRRRPAAFGEVVRACAGTGADVVLLADPGVRRLRLPVTHRLEVPVDGVGAFDSYAAAHTVVCLLAEAVLERRGAAGRERVLRLAARAEELGELEAR
ncbi:MurR/RpiR family transcriptional regulator [Kineococcus gynurae]|uniref:MurR/RpiR family transcriptional regulator n=1 Tax=Kineococcus gynurae TaxID=452979 RepID=A0ABV5LS04_9ACTN